MAGVRSLPRAWCQASPAPAVCCPRPPPLAAPADSAALCPKPHRSGKPCAALCAVENAAQYPGCPLFSLLPSTALSLCCPSQIADAPARRSCPLCCSPNAFDWLPPQLKFLSPASMIEAFMYQTQMAVCSMVRWSPLRGSPMYRSRCPLCLAARLIARPPPTAALARHAPPPRSS